MVRKSSVSLSIITLLALGISILFFSALSSRVASYPDGNGAGQIVNDHRINGHRIYNNIEDKINSEGSANVIIVVKGQNSNKMMTGFVHSIHPSKIAGVESSTESSDISITSDASRAALISRVDGFQKKSDLNIINGYSGTLDKHGLQEIDALKNSGVDVEVYENRVFYLTDTVGMNGVSNTVSSTLGDLSTSTASVNANYSWNILNITGRNITVAVIDTGIDYMHPDLGGCFGNGTNPTTNASCRIIDGYDFVNSDNDPMDDYGHGTAVAGVIGAYGNSSGNNSGITGVAPGASFYALKACDSHGSCQESDIINAITWAVNHNAKIISMSLGAYVSNNSYGNTGKDLLSQAVDSAVSSGTVVVISAGNDGPGVSTINVPAASESAISVGAIDDNSTASTADDTVIFFSSRGPSAFGRLDPGIIAPGVNIQSTWKNETYVTLSGTSLAAPFVSGAVALLLEQNMKQNVSLTPLQARAILLGSSKNITGKIFDKGVGELDIQSAMTSKIYANVSYQNPYGINAVSDRWEFVVIPDAAASYANITLINNNNYNITLNTSIDAIENEENNITLNVSQFKIPLQINISNNSNYIIQINFTLNNFSAAYATTYGTAIIFNGNGHNGTSNFTKNIRIPVVITVPITDSAAQSRMTVLSRTMTHAPTSGDNYQNEDVYYYAYYANDTNASSSSRNITINTSWYSSSDDLNLYLYNSTGDIETASLNVDTNSESVNTLNTDTFKWLRIDGYLFTAPLSFNITITRQGTVSLMNSNPQNNALYLHVNSTLNLSAQAIDTDNNTVYYYWSINNVLNSSGALNGTVGSSNSSSNNFASFIFNSSRYNNSYYDNTMFNITLFVSSSNISNASSDTLTWHVYIDSQAPIINLSHPYNYENDTLSRIDLNYTARDNLSGVDSCWYIINSTNSTYGNANISAANPINQNLILLSCSNTSIYLPSGQYVIQLYANDTVNNMRYTSSINFTVNDISPPIISNPLPNSSQSYNVGSVTLSVNTDENATCRYSDTSGASNMNYDSMAGLFNDIVANHTATYVVSQGTSYTIYVRCRDMSNNTDNSSSIISFSVGSAPATNSAKSSGGGSGGGGGGSALSIRNSADTVTDTIDTMKIGENNISVLSDSIPVSQITVDVDSAVNNVNFIVEKTSSPQSNYTASKVYAYILVNHTGLPSEIISRAKIYFNVDKVWLRANNIDKSEIILLRNVGMDADTNVGIEDTWSNLSSQVWNEDSDTVYYVADSPGLSLYAISYRNMTGENKENSSSAGNNVSINSTINPDVNSTFVNITKDTGLHVLDNSTHTSSGAAKSLLPKSLPQAKPQIKDETYYAELVSAILFSVFILVLVLGIIIRQRSVRKYEEDLLKGTRKELKSLGKGYEKKIK